MTKVTHICDKCKKEFDWLYLMPYFCVDGKVISIITGKDQELCKDCAQSLVKLINNFSKE